MLMMQTTVLTFVQQALLPLSHLPSLYLLLLTCVEYPLSIILFAHPTVNPHGRPIKPMQLINTLTDGEIETQGS